MGYNDGNKKHIGLSRFQGRVQRIRRYITLYVPIRRTQIHSILVSWAFASLLILLVGVLPVAAAAGTMTKFRVPTAGSEPNGITTGPDNALWFTEAGGTGKIGRVTTSGAVTEFSLVGGSTAGFGSHPITTGPDGALWFTEPNSGKIGRITTAGVFSQFQLPANVGRDEVVERANSITAGPDDALWFTSQTTGPATLNVVSGHIGRITTAGTITEVTVPGGGTRRTTPHPTDITVGPDGAFWFTDTNLGKIWRITTSESLTQFTPPQAAPVAITKGPDGALWFTANSFPAAKVGRVTTSGTFTIFTVASSANGVSAGASIATGPDGQLWFTDYDMTLSRGAILSITTGGAVRTFPFPTVNSVDGITAGPDGKMWFTSSDTSAGVGSVGNMTTA